MQVSLWTDREAWDAFVTSHPQASAYHRWAWRDVIEATYRHEPFYLGATDGGILRGVLPMFRVRSLLFGPFLVSLPFSTYAGVLSESGEATSALLHEATLIGQKMRAKYVELRYGAEVGREWTSVSGKVAMWVPLNNTVEGIWSALPSRLRTKVRSAKKYGFVATFGRKELVDDFYQVFSLNMRNLGTPVYPRRWFEEILSLVPDTKILLLRDGGRPVAGTLIHPFRDVCELPWIASDTESRKRNSTALLYWIALEWAHNNGFHSVDLGRCTPGSGTYAFKAQWNCEEVPLAWHYWSDSHELPQLRTDNPKFRLAIRAWKSLPLSLANLIGPRIVRAIP